MLLLLSWAVPFYTPPSRLNNRGFYFRGSKAIRENRESLHHAKVSRYTVSYGAPVRWLYIYI